MTDIAATVADTLGVAHKEVWVVDYRDGSLVLGPLNHCVKAYSIVGKK